MEQNKFYQIKNITEHEYTLVGCNGSVITRPIQDVDNSVSVFTIQDAKDGDVLANDDLITIFRKIGNDIWNDVIDFYVCYNFRPDKTIIQKDILHCGTIKSKTIKPATKEQRDLLFQKMKEAGYEWDTEKKELKEIEQKPTWSEENEEIIKEACKIINCYGNIITEQNEANKVYVIADKLKSLKERMKGD